MELSAIQAYNSGQLTEDVLLTLLKSIKGVQLMSIWDQLPLKFREMEEFKKKLPCLEHYNLPNDELHIDGPPPPKYNCYRCKSHPNLLNNKC